MATALCEKHNLRYDASAQSGCVLCRREQGVLPATAQISTAASDATLAASGAPSELTRPLLTAAAIWLVTAALLFASHGLLVATFLGEVLPEEEIVVRQPPQIGPTTITQTEAVLEEMRKLRDSDPTPGAGIADPTLEDGYAAPEEWVDEREPAYGEAPPPE